NAGERQHGSGPTCAPAKPPRSPPAASWSAVRLDLSLADLRTGRDGWSPGLLDQSGLRGMLAGTDGVEASSAFFQLPVPADPAWYRVRLAEPADQHLGRSWPVFWRTEHPVEQAFQRRPVRELALGRELLAGTHVEDQAASRPDVVLAAHLAADV